jgi:hypothetical protein
VFLQGRVCAPTHSFPRRLSNKLEALARLLHSLQAPAQITRLAYSWRSPQSLTYDSISSKTSPHSFNFIQICSRRHWNTSPSSRISFRTKTSLRQPTFVFIAINVSINAFAIEATPSLTFRRLRGGSLEKLEANNHNPLHQSSWVNVCRVLTTYT